MISEFADQNRRLNQAVDADEIVAVKTHDRQVSLLAEEIFAHEPKDRAELNKQVGFFSELIDIYRNDPAMVARVARMQVNLFNRFLNRFAENGPAPVLRNWHGNNDISVQELLLNSFDARVAAVSLDYRIIYANERYAGQFGCPPGTLIGQHVGDVLGQVRFTTRIRERLDECMAGTTVRHVYETIRPDGSAVETVCHLVPLRAPMGEIIGAVVILLR